MSANITKIEKGFFLLAENTHDKYGKYRKNKKCNKIPAKKGPEMSAKIPKLTRIFLASLKHL